MEKEKGFSRKGKLVDDLLSAVIEVNVTPPKNKQVDCHYKDRHNTFKSKKVNSTLYLTKYVHIMYTTIFSV